MDDVVLGSTVGGMLTLGSARRAPGGDLRSIVATLEAEGLRAQARVWVHEPAAAGALVALFEALDESWRGWEGAKEYESPAGELRLSARHDGRSHVEIEVQLRGDGSSAPWTVAATISTDPGAQMAEAATGARSLLAFTA